MTIDYPNAAEMRALFTFSDPETRIALIMTRARVATGCIHEWLAHDEYLLWFTRRQVAMYQYLRWARDRG